MTPHPLLARAALALAPLALAACAGPLNNEHGIGNAGRTFDRSVYTPASIADAAPPPPPEQFEPTTDPQNSPVYGAGGPVAPALAQPSILSLDRSNWIATTVDVPNDFAAHQPLLTRNFIIKDTDPRAQGKYPNERTALGMSTRKHDEEQVGEAVAAPFVAAADVLLMIPRIIVESRPRQPTRTGSGSEPYARSPGNVVIVNPTLEPQGEPSRVRTTLFPKPDEDPAAAPIPGKKSGTPRTNRPIQPPADDLRPGGGMPATDVSPTPPAAPTTKP